MKAPKNISDNIAFRKEILLRCNNDSEFAAQCYIKASRDFVWFCDVFLWIYCPKDNPECPLQPFILWEYQEDAARKVIAAIGEHDILIEKSRDMGCTWLLIAIFVWQWLFRRNLSFLLGSRKQELVDKTGDPKSLFWKVDFLINNLPRWLTPAFTRTSMHLENLENRSVLDGESTNDDFARGDRRTGIILDEFPAVENGHSILAATRDATNCRIFAGTPQGAAGAFYDTRQKMSATNPERIIRMHWSLHPLKSAGLYTTEDGRDGETKAA